MTPKFYSNQPDDNHCLQASVMMVLNSLREEISWEEVNRLTQFEEGLYSWNTTASVELAKRIPGVKFVAATIEYDKFAQEGESYLQEVLSPEWFQDQKQFASPFFKKEQESAKELVKAKGYQSLVLTQNDISKLLLEGYWLIALVNSRRMRSLPGVTGHCVLVYGQDETNFIMHDPGLPPQSEWGVPKNIFMDAYQGEAILIPTKPNNV